MTDPLETTPGPEGQPEPPRTRSPKGLDSIESPEQNAPTDARDAARPSQSGPRPAFDHRIARQGLIGPFGAAQLLAGVAIVAVVAIVLVAVSTPLGAVVGAAQPNPEPTSYIIGAAVEGLHVGDLAPELTTTRSDGSKFTLTDLSGKPVSLAELRGKAVWINFWASWCPPCQAETPVLRQMDQTYRSRGLVIVGISVQESDASDVAAYVRKYSLGYRIAADLSGDIFHLYRVYALPTQFFIDPSGRIAAVVEGPLDQAGASAQIEAILPK
ncbi:MAG TPA: TlpA disulfide reductase family protein [Candidatus Saccharimonadales bacterium]|nr:TlpA disulfide reductase family protein [Candidatus Saccharimonadales bacterium]